MADEVNNLSKYRKAQKTFRKLFLMSFCVLFVFLLFTPLFFYQSLSGGSPDSANSSVQNTNSTVYGTPSGDVPKGTPAQSNSSAQNTNSASYNRPIIKATPKISPKMTPVTSGESYFPFVLAAFLVTGAFSLLATVFTFLGFLTMTVFAWRKEKREAAGFRLESEKKAIEIEKLKIELQQSKSASATGKIKKCAACNRTYTDASLNFCLDDGAVLSEIYTSEEVRYNPFEKTQVMEGNLPTGQISAETEEIKNKNTAK